MNTRIRYIKQADGTYVSSRYINTTSGEARASIDPERKLGIVHLGNRNFEVRGTSLHKIKIAIKDKLIEFGAEFAEETRGSDGVERE